MTTDKTPSKITNSEKIYEEHEEAVNKAGDIQYFEKQEKVYPKRVWGKYRLIKWLVMAFTLGIYYLSPFIRWDRGPNAPDQAILIDLYGPRAYFFSIEIWPQEVYILTGILILAAIMLFFITSLAGRIWCGYYCPQTVWTDLFVWVERFVQGDRNARRKLAAAPWSFEKIWKLTLTHSIWIVIGMFTGGAFVLYFNDAPTLIQDIINLEASPVPLSFIAGLTLSTYIMAGYAREQVCTYMCPYARFQSAMFDKDTLIIGYDEARGEKRGKHKKGETWDGRGHCIDCTACVQVCPMGIDIRDGLQMECIACGLCIDACDGVMEKIGLEKGLIRYDTPAGMEESARLRKEAGEEGAHKTHHASTFKFFRPRTFYYGGIMTLVGCIMLYALIFRSPLELHILRDRAPVFVQLSNGDIRNGYVLKILNKTHEHKHFTLHVDGIENSQIDIKAAGDASENDLFVPADSVGSFRVYIKAPIEPQKALDIKFIVKDKETLETAEYNSVFITKRD